MSNKWNEFEVIPSKKFGYETEYDYIPFPANEYTRESARLSLRLSHKKH